MATAGPPSAGLFIDREHRLPVRIYYEDTDFTGLVYHASYVRFFERGRSDFLRLAGADHVAMAALGTAFAVVRLEVDFRRAARIDDAVQVATQIAIVRGPRVRFAQRIERDGEVICRAVVDRRLHRRRGARAAASSRIDSRAHALPAAWVRAGQRQA